MKTPAMRTFHDEHCIVCTRKLGDWFINVHHWLNEFWGRYDGRLEHRDFRHHRQGIEEIRKLMGDKAAKAAELHILIDWAYLIDAAHIPENAKEAAALRLDAKRLLSQRKGKLTRLQLMLQKLLRRRRLTTTMARYAVIFFKRKRGSVGQSQKCFKGIYRGGSPTLAMARELRALRWPDRAHEASGWAIVKYSRTRGGGKDRSIRVGTIKSEGDVPYLYRKKKKRSPTVSFP